MEFPATDLWDVNASLQKDDPLPDGDPRYVETEAGRGDSGFKSKLFKTLGVDPRDMTLRKPPGKCYLVFCGHRGCGKSTELKRIADQLHDPALYFVVFVNTLQELDPNNLQYPDVLMALAKTLFQQLEEAKVQIPQVYLTNIEHWFGERVAKHEKTRSFAMEVKAGLKAKTGIPLIGGLFAAIANSFKVNSTFKNELRVIIKNNYSELAEAFNQLIDAAELALARNGQRRRILFVVDGTDRLSSEDSRRFFIEDTYQLQAVNSSFVYCCPIHLLHEGGQLQIVFRPIVLPMIKLEENGQRVEVGYRTMREMLLKRVSGQLFDSEETIETIIQYSGGNPREMLRLLQEAFIATEDDLFDEKAVKDAIAKIALDFKYFLEPADYGILYAIDHNQKGDWESQRVNFLLYHLALLQYNGFWQSSHPVIQTLPEYLDLEPAE